MTVVDGSKSLPDAILPTSSTNEIKVDLVWWAGRPSRSQERRSLFFGFLFRENLSAAVDGCRS